MAEIKSMILGLVFISATLTGMLSFSSDMFNQYDKSVDDSDLQDIQDISSNATQLPNQARNSTGGIADDASSGLFILPSAFQTLDNFAKSLSLIGPLVNTASSVIGLPSWFVTLLLTLATALFIFGLLKAALGIEV